MNEALNWELCRSMLAVIRTGSLSGAARQLGLTQPTLARHVEQLEAELSGVKLFTRSPQGLAPTEAALRLETHALVMESAAAALVREASGPTETISGTVRISASEVVGAEILPPILRDLREQHPGLVFEVQLSNQTVDLLRRDADIAIRMVQPTQGALIARKAGDAMLGMYARRDYLAAHGTPVSMADTAGHSVIGFDRATSTVEALRRIGLPLSRDMFAFRTDSDLAQLSAIRNGFGVGICQVGLASRSPDLVRLMPDVVDFPLPVWVVLHEDLRGVARMKRTFDHLSERLARYVSGGDIR